MGTSTTGSWPCARNSSARSRICTAAEVRSGGKSLQISAISKGSPGLRRGAHQKKLVIWVRIALTTTDEGEKFSYRS